ncbi:glucans biosynthesis glucosyltransferase MdoH [Blastopirellula sp. JC732]|uniref:Glucans biosynthesis glucosyltransferase H n=1 Tax=Blastopirellula sediminis TaxID=2894196 RepID=A0A9X1MT84_9BACT|nr:glucans biosynthesis glucosyltransferase MdoH [Blastopirellula sediminis]MCC9605043.1 glucans biosynthesis glucosyltransferase MdoH [Blastopirellula sediminis]MCC9631657.1 glucans biosynthesis glucosyltransferase MdoH [Blastopirellula sediminis]
MESSEPKNTFTQPTQSVAQKYPKALIISIALSVSALMTWLFLDISAADGGLGPIDAAAGAFFALLTGWLGYGIGMSIVGHLLPAPQAADVVPISPDELAKLPSTAILVPVYNESPRRVAAGVRAMREELAKIGGGETFEFFLLSDTTNPDVAAEEEAVWLEMTYDEAKPSVFYRRRPKNIARKAGNIAEFCERWGGRYRYLIVLDADSLMTAETLVEMVRRMEQDERVALIQVPPRPINGASLLARAQQFAAATYGSGFLRGYRHWCGDAANYWGHNAIIRTRAFIQHCGLPVLPGERPLGGEILSHDFVEAALLRRADWKVHIADDLGGSYEETPGSVLDYLQRDQRWCQGNLQHLNFLVRCPLPLTNRWHLICGAFSYLASPLWLAFVVLQLALLLSVTGTEATSLGISASTASLLLLVGTLVLLMTPKVLAVTDFIMSTPIERRRPARSIWIDAALETVASTLFAPLLMWFHTQFVVATLRGRRVEWNAQNRGDVNLTWEDAWAVGWKLAVMGAVSAVLIWVANPTALIWFSPLLASWLGAAPLILMLSSPQFGRWLKSRDRLVIREETHPTDVMRRQQEYFDLPVPSEEATLERLVRDPHAMAAHIAIAQLSVDPHSDLPVSEQSLEEMTMDERRALLVDADKLRQAHASYWAERLLADVEARVR